MLGVGNVTNIIVLNIILWQMLRKQKINKKYRRNKFCLLGIWGFQWSKSTYDLETGTKTKVNISVI